MVKMLEIHYNNRNLFIHLTIAFILLQIVSLSPDDKRTLQRSSSLNLCSGIPDCLNCTSQAPQGYSCTWSRDRCSRSSSAYSFSWNNLATCSKDSTSKNVMNSYCSPLTTNTSLPIDIAIEKVGRSYGAQNLFCTWSLRGKVLYDDVILKFNRLLTNSLEDSQYTIGIKLEWYNGTELSYNITEDKSEDILKDLYRMDIYYFSRNSFSTTPFKLSLDSYDSDMIPTILISTLIPGAFLIITIIILAVKCDIFSKYCTCCRSICRRRTNRAPINQPPIINLELIAINNGENIKKTEIETVEQLFLTKYKSVNYREELNKFKSECTVCIEKFSDLEEVVVTECGHIFHPLCLKNHMILHLLQSLCPNCNQSLVLREKP